MSTSAKELTVLYELRGKRVDDAIFAKILNHVVDYMFTLPYIPIHPRISYRHKKRLETPGYVFEIHYGKAGFLPNYGQYYQDILLICLTKEDAATRDWSTPLIRMLARYIQPTEDRVSHLKWKPFSSPMNVSDDPDIDPSHNVLYNSGPWIDELQPILEAWYDSREIETGQQIESLIELNKRLLRVDQDRQGEFNA